MTISYPKEKKTIKVEWKKMKKDENGKEKNKCEFRTTVPRRIYELKEVNEKGYDILSYLKNLKWHRFLRLD